MAAWYNAVIVSDGDPLSEILSLPEGPYRTAALAEWLQGLYEDEAPVLVGGAAVELYTAGSYTSGDLDFVGHVPSSVERSLRQAGFVKEGRHWIHENGVFVEFPGSALEPHERVATVRKGSHMVLILSVEDILVDRLAHWQFWRSTIDALNALALWRLWAQELDRRRLEDAARLREVEPALRSLQRFAERCGEEQPDDEAIERWASEVPT